MQNHAIAGVDWTRHWVRCVVISHLGIELSRTVWPRDEAEYHLPDFLQQAREIHRTPILVTGRCRAPWPDGLLGRLTLAGFSFDLCDGPPLGSMLRLERSYREDMAFRPAALLAAIHTPRHPVQDWRTFVLRWSVGQARCRLDALAADLVSEWPADWADTELPEGNPPGFTFPERCSVRPRSFLISLTPEVQTTLF
jgi:hypothetical protein